MQNELNSTDQYDDEIDLRELFSVLWDGKKLIVGITAVFALVAVFYALSIPNQYRATALVSPAEGSGGGLSGALGQLGGLASLAGVSIGGGESSEAQVAQEIMRSRGLLKSLLVKTIWMLKFLQLKAGIGVAISLILTATSMMLARPSGCEMRLQAKQLSQLVGSFIKAFQKFFQYLKIKRRG